MTFLIMSVGVNTIQTQISDLQYQETIIGDYQETTTSEMQTIAEAAANSNVDLDDNPAYTALQLYNDQLDSQMNSLESQLKVLQAQLETYQNGEKSGIKSECKFSFSA